MSDETKPVAILSWEQADQIMQDQRAEIERLRLTDAEREALETLRKWAYEIARDNAFTDEVCDAAGGGNKALTSFLERHK